MAAPDPWMRAMARLYRSSYTSTLGRMGHTVEEDCRVALEEFRALGDKWGRTISLAQLAEFTELRGDHEASIAVLTEAAELGRELGAWGDLPFIEGRLATIRARSGDIDGAWAAWARAERLIAGMSGAGESGRWLGMMRAEIAWRAGDLADVARVCADVLNGVETIKAAWWQGLRAQVKVCLAMVALAQADPAGSRALLGEALTAATGWVERPPLAAVLDATAAYALAVGSPAAGGGAAPPGGATPHTHRCGPDRTVHPRVRDLTGPAAAATLLGAAHAVRGAFDESSPVAPAVRATARDALGAKAFATAYDAGRALSRDDAVTLVRQTLAP
jgi:hypothetical protein